MPEEQAPMLGHNAAPPALPEGKWKVMVGELTSWPLGYPEVLVTDAVGEPLCAIEPLCEEYASAAQLGLDESQTVLDFKMALAHRVRLLPDLVQAMLRMTRWSFGVTAEKLLQMDTSALSPDHPLRLVAALYKDYVIPPPGPRLPSQEEIEEERAAQAERDEDERLARLETAYLDGEVSRSQFLNGGA